MLNSKLQQLRHRFGITTLADWRDVEPSWINKTKGCGPKTLNYLRMLLASHGFTLKGDETPEFWKQHLGEVEIVNQVSEQDEWAVSEVTVVVDTREQFPWQFQGMRTDGSKENARPLIVPLKVVGLPTGDYSIEGFESRVAVERKSLQDLYSTLGQGRERFENELERLAAMEFAAVVVEAGWESIMKNPPPHSRLLPKTVFRSVVAWQQRFVRVHWWACPTRGFAEQTCYRILERFWKDAGRVEKARGVS